MGEAAVVHIIDDDESMRAVLDSLLRSVDYSTCTHASVSEFLAAQRPDLAGCLILDVRMPGISGLDFQGQLADLGIRLPVILMTGHGDVPMSVRGMKAGAVDFPDQAIPRPGHARCRRHRDCPGRSAAQDR